MPRILTVSITHMRVKALSFTLNQCNSNKRRMRQQQQKCPLHGGQLRHQAYFDRLIERCSSEQTRFVRVPIQGDDGLI